MTRDRSPIRRAPLPPAPSAGNGYSCERSRLSNVQSTDVSGSPHRDSFTTECRHRHHHLAIQAIRHPRVYRRGPSAMSSDEKPFITVEPESMTGVTVGAHVHVSLDGGTANISNSTSKLPLASPDSRTITISYSPNRIRALSGRSILSR
ncbi:hypothetical protein INR49_028078 [Caranx melampygus]|nr:hypothetical protein INR49_028078 [Caranx melampygus]